MKKTHLFILLLAIGFAFVSCGEDDVVPEGTKYKVTFTGTWSGASHPTDYPSNAHFSPIIGLSHNASTKLFTVGSAASEGIKNMAETGGTSPLDDEINAVIAAGNALDLAKDDGPTDSGTTTETFEVVVNEKNAYVTFVTMIAPSPDWFIGVNSVNLMENGELVASKTVDASTYDAGTDDGANFTSDDSESRGVISMITGAPLGDGTSVKPLGTFTFEKLSN